MTAPPTDRTETVEDRRLTSGRGRRALFLSLAAGAWAWSTLAHGFGTDLAHAFFEWAKVPGRLAAAGGAAGVHAAEALLGAIFMVLVAAAIALAIRQVRGRARDERRELLSTWALWGAAVFLLWKCCIVFASELVHFGQYALIGALLHAGVGNRRPREAAFLVATLLGVLDEAWQHWGISLWIEGIRWQGFDWSDVILNAAGACGGVLFLASGTGPARSDAPRGRLLTGAVVTMAVLLLPLLLLSRATLARLLGSYTYYPAWFEYDIGKSAHWLPPVEGVPLFVASVLFFGRLVAGVRVFVTHGVALALLALVIVSIDPPSRVEGRPVHEDVPSVLARRVDPGRIVLDGVLSEAEWTRAQRIGPFVRNEPETPKHPFPDDAKGEPAATWARVLWDERALYIAFEADDRDVWARKAQRDDPKLPGDEVVEVFVDPDGDETTYYEFEFSPSGIAYDLFNYIPASPSDFNPWAQFVGLPDWDARDAACRFSVRGTLDQVEDFASAGAIDEDHGFTAEIEIPWRVFRTTTTPSECTRGRLPPAVGERWRLGLFRVERPRTSPRDGRPLTRNDAEHLAQYQAWSPTFRASFHRPERFGVVEFDDR